MTETETNLEASPETTEVVEIVEVVEVVDTPAESPAPKRTEAFVFERPIQTVGRRKEAVVRVRLVPGTGKFDLNGRSLEEYFPNKVHQQLIKAPLVTVDRVENFDIFALLHGGGPSGQAGALRLGIARALIVAFPDDRPPLKKARKAPQYSKR